MKKLFAVMLMTSMIAPAAFAKGNLPMAGCGLGYILFGKNATNDKVLQVLAATTNGTFGNQTFGITSGTLGCTESGMVAKNKEAEMYAEINLRQLSYEIAVGRGEHLAAFSKVLGVKEANQPAFFSLMKSNYSSLFPTANASSTDFLSRLDHTLSAHPELLS